MTQYNFTKIVAMDRLDKEIRTSAIKISLNNITSLGSDLAIVFNDVLDSTDETLLNSIVTNHVGTPLTQPPASIEVSKIPDASPFATPTYRTKRMKTDSVVTVAPNESKEILFKLPTELYTHGGSLIVKNAEIGDYLTAEVEDIDALIPAPYRTALCEAWPIVGQYIIGEYLEVQGVYSVHRIDTAPLAAKITAGLYLSLHYNAINSGTDRQVAINYYMNKKL